MSLFKASLVALIVSCLSTGVAASQEANPPVFQSEAPGLPTDVANLEASLSGRLIDFEAIFNSGKISKLMDFTPPKVLNGLLSSANVSRAQLDVQVDQIWEMTLQFVEIKGFEIDNDSTDVKFLDNGRPYKILPTSTSMKIKAKGSEVLAKSETLALIENGVWYIVRLDEPAQVKMFRDAYPDFDSVKVMAPVMVMDGKEITP